MKSVPIAEAEATLQALIERVARSREPILLRGEQRSAVLVGEDEWRGIQETLYLLSIPGMRDSIKEGLNAPLDECSEEPGW